jgi:replicative DNA helicase
MHRDDPDLMALDDSQPGRAVLRIPPNSVQAESSVLGGLLLDNEAWDRVGDLLVDGDFYRYEHKLIFAAIAGLINASKPADVITVFNELEKVHKASEVGGLAYLNSLAQYVVSAANIRRYAEIVSENATLRKLVSASDTIATSAFNPNGKTVNTIVDEAQQTLQEIDVRAGRKVPESVVESVVRLLDRIQDAADGKAPPSVSTGIPGLDRMIGGGLKGGKQIILAARPSIGKSSLAEQVCLNLALAGHGAAMLSQEMSKDELTDRATANLARIDLDRVISGQLIDSDWPRLTEAIERLRNAPLFFDDQPALTLHDIAAKARMLKRQHGIKLIVLDYLQLCAGAQEADSRHHQIEQLSRGIKALAKQLDLCFITLSQLNREVEKRASGRPVLSDLKESGAIEEDADIVALLSRGHADANGFQIINCDLPKNRQGRVGTLTLGFNGAHQHWQETYAPAEFKSPARKHYTEDV